MQVFGGIILFAKPKTVRSFLLKSENQRTKITGLMLKKGEQPRKASFILQSSNDGINFKDEENMRILRHGKYEYTIDYVFEGITARYFRFVTDLCYFKMHCKILEHIEKKT